MSNLDNCERERVIEVPPGVQSMTYDFVEMTVEELGRKVDEFIRDIDFDFTELRPHFDVSFEISHVEMALGIGVVRTAIGPFTAALTIRRRES